MSIEANESSTSTFLFSGDGAIPTDVKRVRVDPSVSVIPDSAFKDCRDLQEVDLPEGLCQIGPNAFRGCASLTQINFPSTLEVISKEAFRECIKLEKVHLPDSVTSIEASAFSRCKALKQIKIPSSVTKISRATFEYCIELVEVDLPEGLTEIGCRAFSSCESLESIVIPSSVKNIGREAFFHCVKLTNVNLPDSVESIGRGAFSGCTFTKNLRIPPLVTKINSDTFSDSYDPEECFLFSIELPETIDHISEHALAKTTCLRNIYIPSSCRCEKSLFGLAGHFNVELALLNHRFDGLEIHKICYFQSYHPTELALADLDKAIYPRRDLNGDLHNNRVKPNATGKRQDCLGMTPLHILACSTRHNVELYRLLIGAYPQALKIKDKWGDLPLLYAFWSGAPGDILHLFGESYKDTFPGYKLDWIGMIKTMSEAKAPSTCIQNLIASLQSDFAYQDIDLEEIMTDLALWWKQEWKRQSWDEFRDLLLFSVSDRLNSLGVKHWKEEIEDRIYDLGQTTSIVECLFSKLAFYDNLKDATSLLELALWKTKYDAHISNLNDERSPKKMKIDGSDCKAQCRTKCGADVVIPNVLSFLVPKEATFSSSESSESSDDLSLYDSSSDDAAS